MDAGAATGSRAELDAANARIDELTDDLDEANTNLDAANATIVERDAAIKTLQGQLDTANKTLSDLNVKKVVSYVNGDVAKARADAAANRWILIEQPTVSASAPVGVVLDQTPPANSNMINGSVLYLEVAARS
jgi:multidrug resistance efflux pump